MKRLKFFLRVCANILLNCGAKLVFLVIKTYRQCWSVSADLEWASTYSVSENGFSHRQVTCLSLEMLLSCNCFIVIHGEQGSESIYDEAVPFVTWKPPETTGKHTSVAVSQQHGGGGRMAQVGFQLWAYETQGSSCTNIYQLLCYFPYEQL